MKKTIVPIVLMIVALTALSFTAGKGITLRLSPTKGKTYVIDTKTNQTTTMKIQGHSMNSIQRVEMKQTFSAKEVSNNSITLNTQIDAIKMAVTTMGMTLNYDSENPQSISPMIADQAQEFDAIIKKPTDVTYDVLGHLTEADDNDMSHQLSNAIIELPEEELSVGSQWTFVKSQNISDYDVNVNMTYTVTAISKRSVDVSFTGTIDAQEISGTYNGTASINAHTGIVMTCTLENSMSATVSEQGMEIPITITGTATISVKEQ